MSKRLVVFNHKGGVSKTTTVYHLGWMLARQSRVLFVDGDPQCNLTSLVLQDYFEEYYSEDATKKQNIKDGVDPAFKGRPSPINAVECTSPERCQNLFLLAGHANLSEHEASLTFAQNSNNAISTLENLPGAFSELIRLTEERYNIDYTIIDLNPGLSAINQNLFLSAHGFVVPANPDPFSIMAIDTLQTILPRWAEWKRNALELFADSAYPMDDVIPKFCGSVIQRFNIRNGVAALPYRNNINEIKDKTGSDFIARLSRAGMTFSDDQYGEDLIEGGYCLSEIPDFQGLLPKAHMAGVPVFDLRNDELQAVGVVLEEMIRKRDTFESQFEALTESVKSLLDYA
ncbi:MAG: ParA family protein [Pseudomonadota bacterium]